MARIQLPKDALQRIKLGQAFAEYDIIRSDHDLFVNTPATLAALNPDSSSCFFVGRRGAGKTAITFEVERRFSKAIGIIPQIFDLLKLPLGQDQFRDTRQRPFKSLMHSMERALIGEVIKNWVEEGSFSFDKATDTIRRERGLIEDCDFAQRVLNLTEEIFDAYTKDNDKLWLRQISRSKNLLSEINQISTNNSSGHILLIDRLDESWDGSDSAIICLMALMHAAVRLIASTRHIKPYVFIRENIYDRIRAIDNEFSRLETSVVFLDWSTEKLTELVERRLIKSFTTKPKLGGEAWQCFFESEDSKTSITSVMGLCQHRPRDVLMLTSYAIDSAINHGNQKVRDSDMEVASKRYSTSRLKDLGDEYAENYPNISLILEYFFGLGNEYTLVAIEDFIQKLLVTESINKHCNSWFYDFTTPFRFVEVLYGIGFLGIRRKKHVEYKESGKDANAKPSFDHGSTFYIHPTYHEALNLQPILLKDLRDETQLKSEGILEDLPDTFKLDEYKDALQTNLDDLRTLPKGTASAARFEEIVGNVIKLCFFRSLTNVQPHERDHEGSVIRDWVASNRAPNGFWEVIRNKYGSTQVVWECKNYEDLSASDFHQINYYLNDTFGRFGVIAFRGEEVKNSYYRHISNIINRNKSGLVILLTQKDLEVFLRQAIKGAFKESHLQDKYDQTIRQVS
ncbi:P-loop ATPase, Sll1717 family [Pseudomonas oryzihabitans]|uniref:P-loop ATPase, Sll1717 family n=1 Tax=Pseudomonas oryzihabitans TaxID=47885 RepID=UPI0030C3234C